MTNNTVYCKIRRKYVALTPEEEVRQHTVRVLTEQFHYPVTRFSLEAKINVGKIAKRYDIVIYNKDFLPFILVECKAPSVHRNEKTLQQAMSYNLTLNAKYILLTNGQQTVLFRRTSKGYVQQKSMPVLQ